MKLQVEEISPTERRLQIEIPADRVANEFERVFREVGRHARIRGFRPGRIPRSVLERHFSEDIRSQVASSLVREGVSEALEESKLDIVSAPEVDLDRFDEKEALKFSARVEIRPDLGAIDVAGFTVERQLVVIRDEDVDKVLEQLRLRYGELVPIEDRSEVARGDFATVKISVQLDGAPVPSLSVESATVEIAAGHLPAAVDERLALAKVGETFTVNAPPPEGAPAELADKELEYSVTVASIAERRLPALDDDFAKDHGECETLAELRSKVSSQLAEDARRRSEAQMREALLDQLLARQAVDLPPSLVSRRIEELLQEFKLELASRGLKLSSQQHEEEAREKLKARSERDVAIDLLLDRVAGQENVEISDDELAGQIGKIVAAAGNRRDQVREHYEHGHSRDALRSRMRRTRTLERLVSLADVKDVESKED